jgi:hypothetical protein
MRTIIQPSLIALALGLSAIAAPAAASTISYAWTGTVTDITPGSMPFVTLGQQIGITLTLDNAVPDRDPSPHRGIYDQQLQPPVLVRAVNIGGLTVVGSFQIGTVRADDQGVDEFQIDTGDTHFGNVFLIDFKTAHPGVLTSDALPHAIDPRDFESATFFIRRDSLLLIPSAPRFSGTIDFASVVVTQTPLPGSLGLFVPALVGLLGLGGWKRRRAE